MPRPRGLGGGLGAALGEVAATPRKKTDSRSRVPAGRAEVQQEVARARADVRHGRGPRVDTGDVLASATGSARRRLAREAPTRTAHGVTVDTGDILAGQDRLPVPAHKAHRPSFGQALMEELSGHGPVAAKVGGFLFPDAKEQTFKSHGRTYHAMPATAGVGSLDLTGVGRHLFSDAAGFPKGAVIGGYEALASAVEAAQGDTKRAKKLLGGLDDGALGRLLVHGDPAGALKAAKEHPLYSALEVTGSGQLVGRGAGAVARRGALGSRAKSAAGTKRAPLVVVEGDGTGRGGQVVERRYSPNVLVKGLQVAHERDLRRHGANPNVGQGAQRSRLLNQAVDEFAHQAEGTRRRGREETMRAAATLAPVRRGSSAGGAGARAAARVDRARSQGAEASALPGVRGRAERDVVLAAVEGRLHGPATFHADLTRERARLQAVYVAERQGMSASGRRANRQQVKALDRVLSDPKALGNAHEVFRAADAYNVHAGAIERELIAQKALDPQQALAARVRSYGVAVMGLRPSKTPRAADHLEQRHVEAGALSDSARQAHVVAVRAEKKVEAARHRLLGIQASRRARGRKDGKGSATVAEKRRLQEATVALRTARVGRQAAEKTWRDARAAHAASVPRRRVSGLEDAQGRPVATQAILDHIEANGHRTPGFVGHRRDERGASSYFVNWFGGRKTTGSKTRTGEGARQGSYDASFGALGEQLVRGRGVLDAIGTFDHFVGQFGQKRRDGQPYTWDEALRTAEQVHEATGVAMSPVRAVPARYDHATRQDILDRQGTATTPQHLESLTVGRLDDAMKEPVGAERQARNVVLVPAQQLERFRAHQTSGSGPGAKAGQAATRAFRNTVLPFSTKWLVGNVGEATLRSAFEGVTLVDIVYRGPKIMRNVRELDEAAWREADTRIRGGLVYGSADTLSARRGAEDFAGTRLHTPAQAVELVGRLPVIRQTIGGLGVYKRAVFAANRGMERAFQQGVIGKEARRDVQELTGSWTKALVLQEAVAREVARGLLGTPKQIQYARQVDAVLGQYGRFSPTTRRIVQSYAPFLPWFLNAVRFVGYTLPVKHPVKAALLANATVTLQADIEAQAKSVPPGDLEAAIRRKDGGLVNIARYTPFGAFTAGPEGIAAPWLPQIDSAVQILHGNAFTGRPLQTHDGGKPKKLWLALNAIVESAVPGVQIARRIREKGATPFDDSSVLTPRTKPGTARSGAADRILNPLRPVYVGGAGAAPSTDGLPPALKRRVERVQAAQGGGASAREEILQRRAERLQGG